MFAASGRSAHGLVAAKPDPVQMDVSDFLGEAESVHRTGAEHAEDQEVERALEEFDFAHGFP